MQKRKILFDKFEEKLFTKWSLLLVVFLLVISCTISYHIANEKHMDEVTKYSEADYKTLENYILNDVYDEKTYSFTFTNTPSNIYITDFSVKDGKTSFTCYMDRDFKHILDPRVFVKLDASNTLSIVPQSKEIATSNFVTNIISICMGSLIVLVPIFILLTIYLIIKGIFLGSKCIFDD